MIHTINDYCDDCKLPAEKTVHAHNAVNTCLFDCQLQWWQIGAGTIWASGKNEEINIE